MMKKRLLEKGFTLVEMAVVIMILGLVVGAIFSFMKQSDSRVRLQETQNKEQKIATALAYFVETNYRLPCPADPLPGAGLALGQPRNATALDPLGTLTPCGAPIAAPTTASFIGIVPFRALGLSQDDVTDGYNNPYSYITSYTGTRIYPDAITPNNDKAYGNCRVSGVTNSWNLATINYNPLKAVFCCRKATTTPLLVSTDPANLATSYVTPIQDGVTVPGTAANGYKNLALITPTTIGSLTDRTTGVLNYIAYVLISHGANGERSFTFNQAARKLPINSQPSDDENAIDVNFQFLDMPRSSALGANFFDDVVLWRTQNSLMTEFGNDSCAQP